MQSQTDNLGNTTSYFYNADGTQLAVIPPTGYGTYYEYDAIGNLVNVSPATITAENCAKVNGAQSVDYAYSSVTNRLSTITTESTVYTFAYDNFGNTTQVQVGTNTLANYTYAANNGKLSTLTYGNGLVVKYIYDELDRTKEIQYNTGEGGAFETKYAYTYTAAGQLYSVTDYVSEETHLFTYDTQGKKIRSYLIDNTTNEVAYRDIVLYDAQERVSQFTQLFAFANTNVETVTASYTYNTDGEMDHYTQTSTDLAVETNYYYDDLGRATRRKIAFSSGGIGRHAQINYYTFATSNGNTSTLVSSVLTEVFYGTDTSTSDGALTSTTYNLTYDANGNITKIANKYSVAQYQYAYDSMGQLTRENNRALNATYVYTYDNAGNILSKTEYAFTEGSLDGVTPVSTVNYTYSNPNWGDLLTSVGGTNLTYDAIGNIVGIGNTTLTWQGRELLSYGDNATYTYNVDGIRTSKTVNGVKHTYVLYGSQILSETWGDNILLYVYDELGEPVGLKYRNSTYADGVYDCFFFEKNFLGDIISIYNESGTKIGGYTYDAWGNYTITNGTSTTQGTLAYNILHTYNPFRYRGYYFDGESGLYYLNSRYYNPQWGRFINGDSYVSTGQGILGSNMYAYCNNNPVMGCDPCGNCFHRWDFWNDCEKCGGRTFGEKMEKVGEVVCDTLDVVVDVAEIVFSNIDVQAGICIGVGGEFDTGFVSVEAVARMDIVGVQFKDNDIRFGHIGRSALTVGTRVGSFGPQNDTFEQSNYRERGDKTKYYDDSFSLGGCLAVGIGYHYSVSISVIGIINGVNTYFNTWR